MEQSAHSPPHSRYMSAPEPFIEPSRIPERFRQGCGVPAGSICSGWLQAFGPYLAPWHSQLVDLHVRVVADALIDSRSICAERTATVIRYESLCYSLITYPVDGVSMLLNL